MPGHFGDPVEAETTGCSLCSTVGRTLSPDIRGDGDFVKDWNACIRAA
jgi:hypothetical protein